MQHGRNRALGRVKVLVRGTAHQAERAIRVACLARELAQRELRGGIAGKGVAPQLLDLLWGAAG
jgi:hypothetical protein